MAQNNLKQPKRTEKKKKTTGIGWLILVIVLALARLSESGGLPRLGRSFRIWLYRSDLGDLFIRLRNLTGLEPVAVIGIFLLLIVVVVVFVRFSRAAGKAEEGTVRAGKDGRVSGAVKRSDPRAKSFTQPDPYCVVCDHTGEDHFRRDKQQRISQLNEWLKNGLIDREEYRVLKSRYERDL